MASNTNYAPNKVTEFQANKLQYNATGVTATITAGTTTNIDLAFTDDHLLTGFWLIGSGINPGDKIALQAVDSSNIFGYGAGTVLKQFATNIYLPATCDAQFDVAYPAKVYAGLTLRVIYTSTGILSPVFAVNYKIHKIIIT